MPDGRTVAIPSPQAAQERQRALNENPDGIMFVPLGKDVLIPTAMDAERMPEEEVGPFELRGETVAGALQLVMFPFDVPIAFETEEGLDRPITVSNLRGNLNDVVERICSLADLYCYYDGQALVIQETGTFTVSMPPIGDDGAFADISTGLEAITGESPVIDEATRTMIYTATHRTSKRARQFFERLRASTALVIFETYIWEVQLDSANSAGINWTQMVDLGNFNTGISLAGTLSNQVGTPISIGLPTKGATDLTNGDVFRFISEQGAVKTISQPQITVLSGSQAELRVAETRNYIESLTRTTDEDGDETVSTTTGSVDNGFTLTIQSNWDESTIYSSIEIELEEFLGFDTFDAGSDDTLQLPRTTERSLNTQVRSRPGDSILIAGLVRENDQYDLAGPGFMKPLVPTAKTALTTNSELVMLLRPRVIIYQPQGMEIPEYEEIGGQAVETVTSDLPIGTVHSDMLNPAVIFEVEEQ